MHNERENIGPCLRALWLTLRETEHEILVCYDFDADSTLVGIAAMEDCPPSVRLVKNDLGPGVAYAMRAGFQAARGDCIVTSMADLSDPPAVILRMADKIRAGAAVVSGSRYMSGGHQHGGPLLKRCLSRLAGFSLYHVARIGTHDPTTNFRAYRAEFLRCVRIESRYGFELGLELTAKAHRAGLRVDEVPSTWHDRHAGHSQFKLWRWLPHYLRWYLFALIPSRNESHIPCVS